jgi:hypothetical protein
VSAPLSQSAAILLTLNNYVHDVATGLLLISALWLGWSARDLGPAPSREALGIFRKSYRRCLRFVWGSVALIVATGVVRTVNFMDFEWQPAMGRGLVPVLLLKHALIFAMLLAGAYAWLGLRRRLRALPGWDEEKG